MENFIKLDDLEVPPFWETLTCVIIPTCAGSTITQLMDYQGTLPIVASGFKSSNIQGPTIRLTFPLETSQSLPVPLGILVGMVVVWAACGIWVPSLWVPG